MSFFSEFEDIVKSMPSDGKYSAAFPASDAEALPLIEATRQNIRQHLIREENRNNDARVALSQRSLNRLLLSDRVRAQARDLAGQFVNFKKWAASRASHSLRASLHTKE